MNWSNRLTSKFDIMFQFRFHDFIPKKKKYIYIYIFMISSIHMSRILLYKKIKIKKIT